MKAFLGSLLSLGIVFFSSFAEAGRVEYYRVQQGISNIRFLPTRSTGSAVVSTVSIMDEQAGAVVEIATSDNRTCTVMAVTLSEAKAMADLVRSQAASLKCPEREHYYQGQRNAPNWLPRNAVRLVVNGVD